MSTITQLKWAYLTGIVNNLRSPNMFLKKFLWANHQTLPTEDIELSLIQNTRKVAPFVRRNGEAIMVDGYTSTNQTVAAPNIRIKRPFTPSELLFGRLPGTPIFMQSQQEVLSAVDMHIGRDLQIMADHITNAEEWLCAMSLQGTIGYSVTDQEVFTITFPRAGANNITLSVFWDDADKTLPRPFANVNTVKQVLTDANNPMPTDAICGREAANALRELVESGNVVMLGLNGARVTAGTFDLTQQYNDDGVMYLGEMAGVRFWEYSRTADLNGSSTPMIRSKYVEFVSTSPVTERILYYGAIADMTALQGGKIQVERFSKSWEIQDPSSIQALTTSRPLPVARRPNCSVSMKVVSG